MNILRVVIGVCAVFVSIVLLFMFLSMELRGDSVNIIDVAIIFVVGISAALDVYKRTKR